jgi:glutamyl-tRNA reductase
MKLHVVGCSHHNASVAVREKLAFSPDQAREALGQLRQRFPRSEAVVLSTCNRVEIYVASEEPGGCPSHHDVASFLAEFHGLNPLEIFEELFERTGEDTIRHLFTVAASLDSMVVGEAQIHAQVKEAYEMARAGNAAGTLLHGAFQAAIRVARRVANETAIQQKRISIPSVAVGEFAMNFFERFDDKRVLVIGAGEMGEETLRYLRDEQARDIVIINRTAQRSADLAARVGGRAEPWDRLPQMLVEADIVISTTGATEPVVTLDMYRPVHVARAQRPLFVLDLAIPRDFDPQIANLQGIYLYTIDDLQQVCDANRQAREKEWPHAERIIDEETDRYMRELHHRATGPTIRRLKERADEVKRDELQRLLNKLALNDPRATQEIGNAFDRLVNKLLHPPLESLRNEADSGTPHGLLEALKRLFGLHD